MIIFLFQVGNPSFHSQIRCIGTMMWLLWTIFSRNTKTFTRKLTLLLLIVNTNLLVSIVTISNEQGVWMINQMISWLCFGKRWMDYFCHVLELIKPTVPFSLLLRPAPDGLAGDERTAVVDRYRLRSPRIDNFFIV